MARFDMDEWLGDARSVGARFSSKDLRGALGLFSADRMKVPRGVVAHVRFEDGSARLLKGGEEAVGAFEAVVVKSRSLSLDFRFDEVLSREDLPFVFQCSVEVSVDVGDADAVKDFGGVFLTDEISTGLDALHEALRPDVEEAARNYAARNDAAYLARGDRSIEIEAAVREGLKRALFEAGLTLHEVAGVRFESQEYERILGGKIVATVEDEKAKQRDIIRQAWLKDQKDEILSQREVQDLVRALEHEGALKELERRKEKLTAEKELQEFSQKAAQDELEKSDRTASNVVKILEEAGFKNVLDNFLHIAREEVKSKTGARGSGLDPRLHGVEPGRTRRILCAAGKAILAFRPDKTLPVEVHDTGDGKLGLLRSVRVLPLGDREVIAAGAQYGVYFLEEGKPPVEFPIPGAGDKRGGVNAMTVHRDELFATHSDYGLVRWKLDEEGGAGEEVRKDLTAGKPTCRGVKVGPLDRLIFSAGTEVFSLLPESLDGTPTVFSGGRDAVTTFAVTDLAIFGGTAGGEVLRWDFASPEAAPRRAAAKRPDPVFMLKVCSLAGSPNLVIGSKNYAVITQAIELDLEVSYPCEARIRWVDGASDFILGVDRDGRRLFLWEAGNPRAKPTELRSRDRIQDLCVWVERD